MGEWAIIADYSQRTVRIIYGNIITEMPVCTTIQHILIK